MEKNPRFSGLTTGLFEEVEKGGVKAVTSVLTLMEVLVKPKEKRDRQAVEDYRFVLKTFPNLALKPVDESCAEQASDLRAAYGVKPPDALQVGTALSSHATGFVTNDARLKRIREIDVMSWMITQGSVDHMVPFSPILACSVRGGSEILASSLAFNPVEAWLRNFWARRARSTFNAFWDEGMAGACSAYH